MRQSLHAAISGINRVFEIDTQHCPNCGSGEDKIIAAILDRPADGLKPRAEW